MRRNATCPGCGQLLDSESAGDTGEFLEMEYAFYFPKSSDLSQGADQVREQSFVGVKCREEEHFRLAGIPLSYPHQRVALGREYEQQAFVAWSDELRQRTGGRPYEQIFTG